MGRRVVVTGIGAITPLGNSVEESWSNLCQGKSGIRTITKFDSQGIAAEIKNFDAYEHLDYELVRRSDPYVHYALCATREAIEDSSLIIDKNNADRVGVIIGTGAGGISSYDKHHDKLLRTSLSKTSPYFVTSFLLNMVAGEISLMFGARGPSKVVVTACAAGTHAIGSAFDTIRFGRADSIICGGSEAAITPSCIAGFSAMGALSNRVSRPFDKNRDGFVIGEGAGILILEGLDHAMNRGARIHAEIIGYAYNSDALHITEPRPETQAKCIELAMQDAGINKEAIDYINAHGTGTKWNDITETKAIKLALGDYAYKVPISSNKSEIGHTLGAAGAIESIFTILSIENGIIPPTINYETPDPECDLDYVPNVARTKEINVAMKNGFGFGGHNAVLIFRRSE